MSKKDTTPSEERRGFLRLLWGIIARPRATLMYVSERGRRTWWLPALLIVLLLAAPIVVSGPIRTRQMREEMRAAQEEMAERIGQQLSEEELERAQSITASPMITVVFPTVSRVAGQAAGWLIWAAVLYLASMALGGRSSFGQMFPVTVWSRLPYALRGLLQTIYILVSGQVIENPGLSGLAQPAPSAAEIIATPPSTTERLLAAFLSHIDLFLIWHLILLVMAVAVASRLSRRKSALITLGMWIILTALSLVPTLAGGFFAASQGI
jgi:hypothetical protein